MTSALTQAALAAALADPRLVEAWQAGEAQRFAAIGTVDLDTLRRFGGLSYKVRHNGLRRAMPVSFRLLRVLGIELDLFAAYAASRAREGMPLATGDRQRRRDLVAFIGRWRARDVPAHDMLWDIARHESALGELEDEAAGRPPERRTRVSESQVQPLTPESVLAIVGRLIRHDLSYDPDAIAAAVTLDALEGLSPAPARLGYWRRSTAASIARLQLDAFAASVLDTIDGARMLDAVSRALLGCAPSATFLAMAGELVTLGIATDTQAPGAAA